MALVTIGATIWLLISVAFILGALHAPRRLIQVALAILGLEFVLLLVASSTAQCEGGPCVGEEQITEATGLPTAFVIYAIPALTAAFVLYLIAFGLLRHRRAEV